MSINKIIKKVNEEISSMCAANGFHLICNEMIDVSMIWKDGLSVVYIYLPVDHSLVWSL